MTETPASARRRKRILEAAAQLFAQQGYTATSTAQVAAAASASKQTLYAYFGDKAGLLHAVLRSLVTATDSSADAAQVTGSVTAARFEELLQRLAADLISDLMQPSYLAVARIVVAETPRDPTLADLFREAVADRALSRVASLLRAGQRARLVDPALDVMTAARAFVGPLLTHVLLDGLLRAPSAVRPPERAAVQRQVSLFHRGIRHPATSKESS